MSRPRVGIVLFARMSSRRLPGKMLRRIGPTSLLERVVARARCVGYPLVLATSTHESDDPLCDAGRALALPVYRGSLDDVLARACGAARFAGFDAFARLCGDRPFLPIEDMRLALSIMEESLADDAGWDLVTTHLPRRVPPGLLTEIVRTESLERVHAATRHPEDREHVTTWFYSHRGAYRVRDLPSPLQDAREVHMAVDTERDLCVLGAVIEACPDIALPASLAAEALHLAEGGDRDRRSR